jgi:hypothetical protein
MMPEVNQLFAQALQAKMNGITPTSASSNAAPDSSMAGLLTPVSKQLISSSSPTVPSVNLSRYGARMGGGCDYYGNGADNDLQPGSDKHLSNMAGDYSLSNGLANRGKGSGVFCSIDFN